MVKPIFPWMGGKRRIADEIISMMPAHDCYVEPFAGGAAVFFIKEPVQAEVLNDINGDIVNLYRVVKHHLEELYKQFKWMLCSRQGYVWLKATPPETMTDIQRAARWLYIQKTSFGGQGDNYGTATTSKPRFSIYTIEQDLLDAHMRLSQANIESLDWYATIHRYDRPHTLFYLDPPYWQVAGYGFEFKWDHYTRMHELATSIKGEMMISINDHPDIRKLFDDLYLTEIQHSYTVAGGLNTKPCIELVYTTFDPSTTRAQQLLI